MIPVTRTGNAAHDMSAVMARVRKMSDSQLADVLAGKDVSVPQFAAMTEAMGRKQLRQAVDGAQAQQQAKQPSVKDQLLAEQAGLAALPAPNMESMDMASGGIIAFDDGGEVKHFYNQGVVTLEDEEYLKATDPEKYARQKRQTGAWKNVADSGRPYSVAEFREDVVDPVKNFFTAPWDKSAAEKTDRAEISKLMKERDISAEEAGKIRSIQKQVGDKEGDYPMYTPKPVSYKNAPPAAPDSGQGAPSPSVKDEKLSLKEPAKADAGIPALADRKDYLGKYEGAGARMREGIAALKDAKQSDFLLGASKALLGNATLAKAGSEFAGTAMSLGAQARKDEREINKAADEYEFNWAKAMEAASQGNQELAYKYAALADQAKYRAGILGIKGQELSMHKDMYDMVKIPAQLSKVYADAKKEVDAAYNNMVPANKRAQYQKDIEDAYRKRAGAVGLGKYVDTYAPSTSLTTVSQLPKGVSAMKLPDDA